MKHGKKVAFIFYRNYHYRYDPVALESEAMIAIVKAYQSYREGFSNRSLDEYVKIIIKNSLITEVRKQKVYAREYSGYNQAIVPNPHSEVMTKDFWDWAMSQVNESERELLRERFINNRSLVEMGKMMGVRWKTVDARIKKLLYQLRRKSEWSER